MIYFIWKSQENEFCKVVGTMSVLAVWTDYKWWVHPDPCHVYMFTFYVYATGDS